MRRKVARRKPASTGTIVAWCVVLGLGGIVALYAGGLLDPRTAPPRKIEEKGGAAVSRTSTTPEGQTPASDSGADTPKAPRKAEAPPPKPKPEEIKPAMKLGEEVDMILYGKLTKRPHPTRARLIWDLHNILDRRIIRINEWGEIDPEEYVNADVKVVAVGKVVRGEAGPKPDIQRLISVDRLSSDMLEELNAAVAKAAEARAREFNPSPNAKPFMGTWGLRMPLPSEMWADQLAAFDAKAFSEQLSQLTSASHIVVNVTHPAGPCYFTGPHPELAKIVGPGSFPTRDLLGEVLDSIAASGKRALVYFACEGFHTRRAPKEKTAAWDEHIESLNMYHVEAVRKLILQHYLDVYGSRTSGWWFDGAKMINDSERPLWKGAVLAANPEAIVAFNSMAGPPFRSKRECDYFGGHPTPRSKHKFWEPVNEPMITAIEAGPWMDSRGSPVDDPGYGALGHVFMGLQDRWTLGKCEFPPDQAIEWTTRVLAAGGMYTWAVPRSGSKMAEKQFRLLLRINKAVESMRKKKQQKAKQ